MAESKYRNIFLTGFHSSIPYTTPPRPGGEPTIPDFRNRYEHSEYLHRRFDESWKASDEGAKAVAVQERNGVYIEFAGEPGYDLIFERLEHIGSGVRLLNVRTEGDEPNRVTRATVYIPNEKRPYFLRKVEEYADSEKDTSGGHPKNSPLIDSISQIREATLASFFWSKREFELVGEQESSWIEVWLLSEEDVLLQRFVTVARKIGIEVADGVLRFPERTVLLINANREQLIRLVASFEYISEFRIARKLATYFVELENAEQAEIAERLLQRCAFDGDSDVSVCLLDTGVNNGHPLLRPILHDDDRTAVLPDWPSTDEPAGPHGTLMAGTAGYGNLLQHLNSNENLEILHRLESVRILPPFPERNPKEFWGYLVVQAAGISEIQAPARKRVFCMAVSSEETKDRGHPTSWSGAIDKLTSGQDDDIRRLFVIAAGNASPDAYQRYPNGNLIEEIHDPGQSWNAITVGAYTELVEIRDSTLEGYSPLAPSGGLSPSSTTSKTWPHRKWPIKPDVVFEGGNVAAGPNDSRQEPLDLQLISTSHDPQIAHFAPFGQTSAASAQAAEMAARIQVEYPDAWPETVRGLMIHSADWTAEMKKRFTRTQHPTKQETIELLRTCGFGVPSLERALYCASNSLTLISEAEIQPFDKRNANYVTRDMHLYDLPWPSDILLELAETAVAMRVTLSYFIEPGPGEVGWGYRYRYPSHGLRFDVNGPTESQSDFVRRVNFQARGENERIDTTGAVDHWTIGANNRQLGSIHSDTWTGTAAQLSQSNKIAVYPTKGWWSNRPHLNLWHRQTRYSLIVSIDTPEMETDIYLAVATKIGITTPVTISV